MFGKNIIMKTIIFITILTNYFFIVILRSILLKWKSGKNAFQLSFDDTLHGYNSRLFILLVLITPIILLIYILFPELYLFTNPYERLESHYSIKMLGILLSVISLAWTLIAQLQMKDSWRIGINTAERTELKTKGIFSISRNPIFLGIIIANIGVFLMLPNSITFAQIFLSHYAIQTQIYLEEEYLEKTHLTSYLKYKRKVRRWIGKYYSIKNAKK